MAESEIKRLLADKRRRMTSGKLYKVINKNGQLVPFIPNENQLYYLENKHNLNIIPKARQLGMSTVIDLDFFDDMLFNRGFKIGIIADKLDTAIDVFRNKILVAWDNLPEWLRNEYDVVSERRNELSLSLKGGKLKSMIYVGTSFRWWTLQRLHISEFGKICALYPDKAKEIITWALNTVAIGQVITIESTAMGRNGAFYEMSMRAKELEDKWQIPNAMQYKLFFFPWRKDKGYEYEGNINITAEKEVYFKKLEDNGIKLTQWQKNRYILTEENQQGDMKSENPSTFDEAFENTIEGAYYEKQLTLVRQQNRICKVNYDPTLLVHTAWDLWGAWWWDSTVIWYYQIYWKEIRIIDYFEGNGLSLIEIINTQIKTKGYNYWNHYWPWDMRITEYSTWKTRFDVAWENGIRFDVLKQTSVSDWIDKVKNVFGQCRFDEIRCSQWVNWLWQYRRAYSEKLGFLDRPQHNDASHAADAFRTLAWSVERCYPTENATFTDLKI